jgi:hypothetical protein
LSISIVFECSSSFSKRDSCRPQIGILYSQRAALFNTDLEFHQKSPLEMENELTNHFKGLKGTVTEEISKELNSIKTRKDSLQFQIY